jgi:thioredoxin reductase
MSFLETAIIGSGPYGLSLAAHLRHQGVSHELFGQPMQSWSRFMPKGMLLKSEGFASNLWDPRLAFTLENFCREKGLPYQATALPVPLDTFLEYAAWFQEKTGAAPNGLSVARIERADRGMFSLTTTDGQSFTARRVVLATGHMSFMNVPEVFHAIPSQYLSHTAQLHDLTGYRGQDVTVIGAGQSAIETAALLIENGARVRLVARKDIKWNPPSQAARSLWESIRAPESGLAPGWRSLFYAEKPEFFRHLPIKSRHRVVATKWGPTGSAWLFDRVVNKAELRTGYSVGKAAVSAGRVQLEITGPQGTAKIETDRVVCGTGFRADVDRVAMLSPEIRAAIARENLVPKLDATFQTTVPNLFVVGILSAPTFGPVMRFMFGAKHAAPIVARRISADTAKSARPAAAGMDASPAGSLSGR